MNHPFTTPHAWEVLRHDVARQAAYERGAAQATGEILQAVRRGIKVHNKKKSNASPIIREARDILRGTEERLVKRKALHDKRAKEYEAQVTAISTCIWNARELTGEYESMIWTAIRHLKQTRSFRRVLARCPIPTRNKWGEAEEYMDRSDEGAK